MRENAALCGNGLMELIFYPYSAQYSLQATCCFPKIPIVETMDRGGRGTNPLAMTIINPRKEYWPSQRFEPALSCSKVFHNTHWAKAAWPCGFSFFYDKLQSSNSFTEPTFFSSHSFLFVPFCHATAVTFISSEEHGYSGILIKFDRFNIALETKFADIKFGTVDFFQEIEFPLEFK